MRDEADDALAVRGRQTLSGVGKALGQPVNPEPSIGIEHHLDDRRVFQESGDGGAKGGAQHARASKDRFRLLVRNRHVVPVLCGTANTRPWIGDQ